MFTLIRRRWCLRFSLFFLPPGTLKMTTTVKILSVVVVATLVVSISASPPYNIVWGSLLPYLLRNQYSQTGGLKYILLTDICHCLCESWGRRSCIRRNSVSTFPPLEQIVSPGPADITPPNIPTPPSSGPTQIRYHIINFSSYYPSYPWVEIYPPLPLTVPQKLSVQVLPLLRIPPIGERSAMSVVFSRDRADKIP